MVLIDGEAEVQQLQLAVVTIEQVTSSSTILASASHILSKPVECCTFLAITLGVLAISLPDVILEGLDPIDLVGLLQRAGKHG